MKRGSELLPLDERSFGYPIKLRIWVWFSAISCLAIVVGLPVLFDFEKASKFDFFGFIFLMLFFGGSGAFLIPVLFIFGDRIVVSEEGIRWMRKKREHAVLSWGEVGEVRSRHFLQRLELFDKEGALKIKLEYQLEKFEELAGVIHGRFFANFSKSENRQSVFEIGYQDRFSYFLVGVFFVLLAFVSADPLPKWLFVIASVCFFSVYFNRPKKLEINENGLVIRTFFGKRPIGFHEIDEVEFGYTKNSGGIYYARIGIRLRSGGRLFLQYFEDETSLGYHRIRECWEKWIEDGLE